MIAFSCNYF